MDSQIGGKMIRTKLGGDPLKNSKVVADDAETVVELEETKNAAMQIGLILIGLSLCMIPGLVWIVSNMAASKKHKGLLEQLQAEVLKTVPGSRLG